MDLQLILVSAGFFLAFLGLRHVFTRLSVKGVVWPSASHVTLMQASAWSALPYLPVLAFQILVLVLTFGMKGGGHWFGFLMGFFFGSFVVRFKIAPVFLRTIFDLEDKSVTLFQPVSLFFRRVKFPLTSDVAFQVLPYNIRGITGGHIVLNLGRGVGNGGERPTLFGLIDIQNEKLARDLVLDLSERTGIRRLGDIEPPGFLPQTVNWKAAKWSLLLTVLYFGTAALIWQVFAP